MQDETLVMDGAPPLSQVARVVDTFVAPRKTFTDILRSASCWLPLVLTFLMALGYGYVIDKKVGFAAVTEQQISKNPRAEEQMASLSTEDRAKRMAISVKITRIITYVSVVPVLIIFAIEALLLWASFNFMLGANTTFPRVFAVIAFAALPRSLLLPLLSMVLMSANVGTENFDIRNPVGTNLGYYLSDSPHWMQTAGQFFDVFGLWSLALMVIGLAIISRKTIAQSATVVVGWWALILVVVTGVAAL